MDAIVTEPMQSVPQRIARAWALLCGQTRVFEWNPDGFVPDISAYAYLMTLDIEGSDDKAGIAISLSQKDARDMASAMFKLPVSDLDAHDVDDACLEVCNMLADVLSDVLGPKERLHTRLPQPLEANGYRQLLREGALWRSLRSDAQGQDTSLMVFNRIHPGFETRPAPL